jgi:hypothetical protein
MAMGERAAAQTAKRWLRASLARIGLELRRPPASELDTEPPSVPYVENPESGPGNLEAKRARVAVGGPFEWPNIVMLNRAVADLLGPAQRIAELGGGTGLFASEAATDPSRHIVCSEFDSGAHQWARTNRPSPQIDYVQRPITADDGPFDMVVAIEVIEHIADYASFLETCRELAPCALITTPNRLRERALGHAGPPDYDRHVREWSAGEFYWVLRSFWPQVELFGMPYDTRPETRRIDVNSRLTPLIARCHTDEDL